MESFRSPRRSPANNFGSFFDQAVKSSIFLSSLRAYDSSRPLIVTSVVLGGTAKKRMRSKLKVSERSTRSPYIYAAIAFCDYTGTRRSEMFRCLMDDVSGRVLLREKKRTQKQRFTFHEVPLHPELAQILDEWRTAHPGGPFLFAKNNGRQLDDKTSREAFVTATKNSKWVY